MSCFALVPAAGGGSRMAAERPKQYLPLAGRPLVAHALATLCAVPAIERVYVVLAPGDEGWEDMVPPYVDNMIKDNRLFGYVPPKQLEEYLKFRAFVLAQLMDFMTGETTGIGYSDEQRAMVAETLSYCRFLYGKMKSA